MPGLCGTCFRFTSLQFYYQFEEQVRRVRPRQAAPRDQSAHHRERSAGQTTREVAGYASFLPTGRWIDTLYK